MNVNLDSEPCHWWIKFFNITIIAKQDISTRHYLFLISSLAKKNDASFMKLFAC